MCLRTDVLTLRAVCKLDTGVPTEQGARVEVESTSTPLGSPARSRVSVGPPPTSTQASQKRVHTSQRPVMGKASFAPSEETEPILSPSSPYFGLSL